MTELITRTQLAAELNIHLSTLCQKILLHHGNRVNFPAPVKKIHCVLYYNKADVFEFIKAKENEAMQTRLTNKIRAKERAAVRSKNVAKKLMSERRLARIISTEKRTDNSISRLTSLDVENKKEALADQKRARSNPIIEYSGIALMIINFCNRAVIANRVIGLDQLRNTNV